MILLKCWAALFYISGSVGPVCLMCMFIVTGISRFVTRTTKLHLTENKGLSHRGLPLACIRFVQADRRVVTDYIQFLVRN
jgi:hypothetical protein